MTAFSIRQATISDAEGIARVRVNTWRSAYKGIVSAEMLDWLSVDRDAARWRENLSSPQSVFVYVAEAESQIVGFATGGAERSGDPDYTSEVYAIYILPQFQGQGIGRALMEAGRQWLVGQSFTNMLFWVLKDNLAARAFYAALGGKLVSEKTIEIGPQTLAEVGYGFSLKE
jgi:ribosomal protein S18 acetylase RimI-like enzyme